MKEFYKEYDKFCDLLLKYNKTHKLTGAKDKKEIIELIEDSLYPFLSLEKEGIKKVLDIGSGAGFPGMALAIKYKEIEFFLVEPLQKRFAFLHLIKSVYGLKNVKILKKRVEEVKPFDVDLITSKAVGKVDEIFKICKAFLKDGVKVLLYKGASIEEEIKRLKKIEQNIKDFKVISHKNSNYLLIRI